LADTKFKADLTKALQQILSNSHNSYAVNMEKMQKRFNALNPAQDLHADFEALHAEVFGKASHVTVNHKKETELLPRHYSTRKRKIGGNKDADDVGINHNNKVMTLRVGVPGADEKKQKRQ
jgi:hypothetical protein